MATMRFSVPDEVKEQFDREFAGENKSQVISRLMIQAVEERRVQEARARTIDTLLRRRTRKPVTNPDP